MRARFFGPTASTAPTTERLRARRSATRFSSLELDIRDADARRPACSPQHARLDRARDPHRRAAVARLGGVGPADRLRRQRQRHAEPARGDPPPRARRDVHLLLDQQGLRRPAQPAAARRARAAARAARGPPLLPRDRHVDVDRRLDPLAVRRLEGGGRPARAGVRPLLRHADGLLPRRLPDRPQPRRRRSCTASSPT